MASPKYGKSGKSIGVKFGKTGKSVAMASDRVAKARTSGRTLYEDASMGPAKRPTRSRARR